MIRTYDVFSYGFAAIEENYIKTMLPNKKSVFTPTDCFTDIIACNSYAVFINTATASDSDLNMLWDYYLEVGATPETVILVGNIDIPKRMKKQIRVYASFDDLQPELKYILLSAYRNNKKIENFSITLANSITILSKIRLCPGTTTTQLAEELEISKRSVQRYIATLSAAGEWIEYDRTSRGWKLTEGKSVLWVTGNEKKALNYCT